MYVRTLGNLIIRNTGYENLFDDGLCRQSCLAKTIRISRNIANASGDNPSRSISSKIIIERTLLVFVFR